MRLSLAQRWSDPFPVSGAYRSFPGMAERTHADIMTTILPPPGQLLGLPPDEATDYPSWYPSQDYAVSAMLNWLLAPGQP